MTADPIQVIADLFATDGANQYLGEPVWPVWPVWPGWPGWPRPMTATAEARASRSA